MDDHGISLTFPPEAPASGPIPVEATLRADPTTYWDNDGILDKALTVALVRRDRPGLRLLETIDPHALMLPDAPLPGRPSDAELAAERWTVAEVKPLDATTPDETLRGQGDYFVVGGFATFWTGPFELRMTDAKARRAPAPAPARRPDGSPWPVRILGREALARARVEAEAGGRVLVLPFHVDLSRRAFPPGEERGPAWLTVLGLRLASQGGACGGLYAIELERASTELSGEVSIPLASLGPVPGAGRWLFQAFIGHQALSPAEVTLPNDDAV